MRQDRLATDGAVAELTNWLGIMGAAFAGPRVGMFSLGNSHHKPRIFSNREPLIVESPNPSVNA